MTLEENMIIGKMVIKDLDGAVVKTSVYPHGAIVLSYEEVNFDVKNSETGILLRVASKISDSGADEYGYFQKRIQLIKGQYAEFEPISDGDKVPLGLLQN